MADTHRDLCAECGNGGDLLCCDSCPRSCHLRCAGLRAIPEGDWECSVCEAGEGWSEGGDGDMVDLALHPNDGPQEAVSLAQLLQQLELVTPHSNLLCAVTAVRRFMALSATTAGWKAWPHILPERDDEGMYLERMRTSWQPPAAYSRLLVALAGIVGKDTLIAAATLLHTRGPAIAFGFGTMGALPCSVSAVSADGGLVTRGLASQACRMCGAWRILRSICVHCGASHRFCNGGPAPSANLGFKFYNKCLHRIELVVGFGKAKKKTGKDKKDGEKMKKQLSLADTPEHDGDIIRKAWAAAVEVDDPPARVTAVEGADEFPAITYESCVMRLRQGAVGRALEYLRDCGKDKSLLDSSGGDMMFLVQKACMLLRGKPEWSGADAVMLMKKFARSWMRAHLHVTSVTSVKQLQDCVEGLHGIKHAMLLLGGKQASPPPPKLLTKLAVTSSMKSVVRGPRVIPSSSSSESDSDSEDAAPPPVKKTTTPTKAAGAAKIKSPTPTPVKARKTKSATRSDSEEEKPVSARLKRNRASTPIHTRTENVCGALSDGSDDEGLEVPGFDFERVREDLSGCLMGGFGANDIMGFDPLGGKLPMSPLNYCSHCGMEGNRMSLTATCTNCNCKLASKVDYGCMTDAVVWYYVFSELGLPIMSMHKGSAQDVTLDDIVVLLPAARAYKDIDELGHNFFILQAYFVTHFLYVVSEWGKHRLPQELFFEELSFIMNNMKHVVSKNDPELVGEFLHCLRILGVSESDPGFTDTFREGIAFLLHCERRSGERGLWVPKTASTYSRYHAAYTGIVGCCDVGAPEPLRVPKMFL